MPDAFVALLNFAPLFAPLEILECYLPSFDGELAPSSIGWGAMHLPTGSGGEVMEVIGLLRRQAAALLFGGAGVSSHSLLFATGRHRPIAAVHGWPKKTSNLHPRATPPSAISGQQPLTTCPPVPILAN